MNDSLALALASLPHGPEFRFIDQLLELNPGIAGRGEFTVKSDATYLRGHFPGEPLMPGVLMIEALAQLAGTIAQSDPKIKKLPNLKLTALRSVKILGTATPGQRLVLEATILGRLGNLIQAAGVVRLENMLILEAQLTLSGDPVTP